MMFTRSSGSDKKSAHSNTAINGNSLAHLTKKAPDLRRCSGQELSIRYGTQSLPLAMIFFWGGFIFTQSFSTW